MKAYAGNTPAEIFYLDGVKYKLIGIETREVEDSDEPVIIWKVKVIEDAPSND